MSVLTDLQARANAQCELCAATDNLKVYAVPAAPTGGLDKINPNHWRCLNDSMWSTEPPVQVMAWRMLHRMRGEGWPQGLLDMMYIEPETLKWAKSTEDVDGYEIARHKDVNGQLLQAGDNVVLIQDLNVKGANFTAKRGTAVRRITLVKDNVEHIEGKINGQHIVILTKYVKKQK